MVSAMMTATRGIPRLTKNNMELPEMVAEFQAKMESPTSVKFWLGLMHEEASEVKEAFAHLLKEMSDYAYVCTGLMNTNMENPELQGVPVTKQMQLCEALATMVNYAFPGLNHEVVTKVHESNMSKLGDDGKPVRRESDGKILKGPNYKAPDIVGLLDVILADEVSSSVN